MLALKSCQEVLNEMSLAMIALCVFVNLLKKSTVSLTYVSFCNCFCIWHISSNATYDGDDIVQGCPTCGSRAICVSLEDYLWLSINVPEFPFHCCVIIF